MRKKIALSSIFLCFLVTTSGTAQAKKAKLCLTSLTSTTTSSEPGVGQAVDEIYFHISMKKIIFDENNNPAGTVVNFMRIPDRNASWECSNRSDEKHEHQNCKFSNNYKKDIYEFAGKGGGFVGVCKNGNKIVSCQDSHNLTDRGSLLLSNFEINPKEKLIFQIEILEQDNKDFHYLQKIIDGHKKISAISGPLENLTKYAKIATGQIEIYLKVASELLNFFPNNEKDDFLMAPRITVINDGKIVDINKANQLSITAEGLDHPRCENAKKCKTSVLTERLDTQKSTPKPINAPLQIFKSDPGDHNTDYVADILVVLEGEDRYEKCIKRKPLSAPNIWF